jgi:hypothetical protein
MAGLSGLGNIGAGGLYTSTASPAEGIMIGQLVWDGKTGKAFRYVLNGAADLVAGNLLCASVQDTTYENMTIGTAAAAGDAYLQVTNGTATITSEQFRGGTINVYTAGTVPIGDEYTITAVTGTLTTGGALKVWLDRPLRYAVTTSAKVNMKQSPWSKVIQSPGTTMTEMAVGVAVYPITASQYGWVQTHGVCSMLVDATGTVTVGSDIGYPSATAGSATVYAAGTGKARVGVVRQAGVAAKGITAFLQID